MCSGVWHLRRVSSRWVPLCICVRILHKILCVTTCFYRGSFRGNELAGKHTEAIWSINWIIRESILVRRRVCWFIDELRASWFSVDVHSPMKRFTTCQEAGDQMVCMICNAGR